MKARDILISLSLKYDNNWEKIYNALSTNEPIDEELLSGVDTDSFVTMLDAEYPEELKHGIRPEFVYPKSVDLVDIGGVHLAREEAVSKLTSLYKKKVSKLSELDPGTEASDVCDLISYILDSIQELTAGKRFIELPLLSNRL